MFVYFSTSVFHLIESRQNTSYVRVATLRVLQVSHLLAVLQVSLLIRCVAGTTYHSLCCRYHMPLTVLQVPHTTLCVAGITHRSLCCRYHIPLTVLQVPHPRAAGGAHEGAGVRDVAVGRRR
jgi:hypothetical protein